MILSILICFTLLKTKITQNLILSNINYLQNLIVISAGTHRLHISG